MTASSARVDVRKMLGSILVFLVIAVVLIWTLFPIYWAAISSVKSSTDNYGNLWIPWVHFQPTLKPWRDMFALPEIKSATVISTQLSLGAATLSLILGTLAAYGIARFRFFRPQNGSLTTWFLSQRIAPPVIFVAPYFLIMRQAGLLDNVWGLIILNATFNMTFPIIILTQMFREVPVELEEAAQVDGASRWEMFFRISLPLVAPGLVVAWMLALAFSWNEFLFAFSTTVPEPATLGSDRRGRADPRGRLSVRRHPDALGDDRAPRRRIAGPALHRARTLARRGQGLATA